MHLKDILIILGSFYCILTLKLLCRKSVIVKNHALFGVNLVCLKFGLCKENYILQHWWESQSQCIIHCNIEGTAQQKSLNEYQIHIIIEYLSIALCSRVQRSAVRSSALQCSEDQCCAVQCSAVQCTQSQSESQCIIHCNIKGAAQQKSLPDNKVYLCYVIFR